MKVKSVKRILESRTVSITIFNTNLLL